MNPIMIPRMNPQGKQLYVQMIFLSTTGRDLVGVRVEQEYGGPLPPFGVTWRSPSRRHDEAGTGSAVALNRHDRPGGRRRGRAAERHDSGRGKGVASAHMGGAL
jgi:hypothetical protein